MKLPSEELKLNNRIRNYLKKNKVIEARLRFNDGTIMEYSQPSEFMKAIMENKMRNGVKKHIIDGIISRDKKSKRRKKQ